MVISTGANMCHREESGKKPPVGLGYANQTLFFRPNGGDG